MSGNWKEIIKNEIWTCENFLQDEMIENMLNDMKSASEKTLDGGDAKHLVGNTYYNYNVVNSLRSNEKYKNAVIDNLNTLYKDAFGKIASKENLSDEDDGLLRIPTREQCDDLMTDGFKEMMEKVNVRFSGPLAIKPKKNTCVVMRVGLAHFVEPCTGHRPCVTGWSFASKEYMEKYNG
jgi:uncharacterized protein YdbL (DUF1318 family)